VSYGSVAYYLALLSNALGDLDRAQAQFEEALRFNLKLGAKPALARTQVSYASALLNRKRGGDRERAVHPLREAQRVSNEIGMLAIAAEATELARRLEPADSTASRAHSPAVEPSSLRARERLSTGG